MRLHVICIGDEILLGHTTNMNLTYLGNKLHEHGYMIQREVCIPDTPEMIRRTLREELREADIIITVGGLGPTKDDVTRPVIAEELGLNLNVNEKLLTRIRDYLSRRHVNIPEEAMRTQAMVPDKATILPNNNGTAPGLWCKSADKAVIMLPGPPRELEPMFEQSVLPGLRQHSPPDVVTTTIHTCGMPESRLAEQVEGILEDFPQVATAFCARPFLVDVRLTATPENGKNLEQAEHVIRRSIGATAFPKGITTIAQALAEELKHRSLTVCFAESCTGGELGSSITEIPGASTYFAGGIVAYSNEIKQKLLGVSTETLKHYGAVSEQTAREMTRAAMKQFGTDTSAAVTGIAGPGGGTADKPVGLVYVATAIHDQLNVQRFQFPGNRDNIRRRTTTTALNQLRLQIMNQQEPGRT